MDIINTLENRLEFLLSKLKELENENATLRAELEQELHNKEAVKGRIDNLLKKIQEETS